MYAYLVLYCMIIQGGTILGAPTEIIPLGHSELPYDVFLSYLEELSQNTFRFVFSCIVHISLTLWLNPVYFGLYTPKMGPEFQKVYKNVI